MIIVRVWPTSILQKETLEGRVCPLLNVIVGCGFSLLEMMTVLIGFINAAFGGACVNKMCTVG